MDVQLLDMLQKLEVRLEVIQISLEQLQARIDELDSRLQGEVIITEDFNWD